MGRPSCGYSLQQGTFTESCGAEGWVPAALRDGRGLLYADTCSRTGAKAACHAVLKLTAEQAAGHQDTAAGCCNGCMESSAAAASQPDLQLLGVVICHVAHLLLDAAHRVKVSRPVEGVASPEQQVHEVGSHMPACKMHDGYPAAAHLASDCLASLPSPSCRRHSCQVMLLWQHCFTQLAATCNTGSHSLRLRGAATCSHSLKCEVQPAAAACRRSGGSWKAGSQQASDMTAPALRTRIVLLPIWQSALQIIHSDTSKALVICHRCGRQLLLSAGML